MHKMNVKNRTGLVNTHLLRGRYVLENKDVLMKYSLALLLILSFASSVSAVEDNQPCVEETRALMNVSSSWEAILKSMQDDYLYIMLSAIEVRKGNELAEEDKDRLYKIAMKHKEIYEYLK